MGLRGRELITRFGLSDEKIWNRDEGRKAREGKGERVISHQGMTYYSQREVGVTDQRLLYD